MASRKRARPTDPVAAGIVALVATEYLPLDWVARHLKLKRLAKQHPKLHPRVLKYLSPDEALEGTNTGAKPSKVIALPGPVLQQVTLDRWLAN